MASTYLLVAAVVVSCFSVWFGLNLQPFTLNTTLRVLQRQLAATPAIDFYKLSFQWPPSTCNSGMTCKQTPPREFTIHGIWPQDINDKQVPPYDPRNPCTNLTPTPASSLQVDLNPILQNLTSLWPNLKDSQSPKENLDFWKYEWNKHGTCSDYPTQPLVYFSSALQLRNGLDPVMRLTPGSSYMVQDFSAKVQSVVGAYPEIACNKNKVSKALQLWEIRLCYKKPTPPKTPQTIQNCTKRFSGQCTSLTDLINFPI